MPTAFITKIEHFNAAHKLFNPNWSEEKNWEVFSKCANPNFHGHNYTLYVTVKGQPHPDTGFIINAKNLGVLIKEKIVEVLDHKNLNLDDTFMKGQYTSVENLTINVWRQLEAPIKQMGGTLHKIKIQETPTIYAEYYGE